MNRSPDLIDTTLGQYYVEGLIGQGGMGYVYRARDTVLGRTVALKVLPPEVVGDASGLARFIQEARAASALNHPHVVTLYEIRESLPMRGGAPIPATPAVHYLAMELVIGETVRSLIDSGQLSLKRALDLFVQVAEALAAAHTVGIVHRDLKPENVMVSENGYAKVLDFGLAKLRAELVNDAASQNATMNAVTGLGVLLGTVGYMSPEQAQGHQLDHRSDIFSFGCVLYEAVTGARAFAGNSAIDTLHQIVHVEPELAGSGLRAAPSELHRIIRKCLAKDPDDRYQSIKETSIDLRELLRQLDSGSVGAVARPSRLTSRRMALAFGALGLVTAAAAAGWLAWRPSESAAPPAMRIERLTASGNVGDAALSPDGKYLAYVEFSAGKQSLWVRQIDGTNPLELIPPRAVGYWGAAFAPDSGSIFFAIKSDQEPSGSLYRIPLLGGTPRRLVTGIDSTVTFSPNGRELAYLRADNADAGSSALMIAGVDGANPHPLAARRPPEFFAPGFFIAPSWSPDGAQLVAPLRNSETRAATLVTVALDGAVRHFGSTYAEIGFTSWLPDRSGVLFIARGTGLVTGRGGEIWMQPYPDGTARRLTSDLIDYRNVWVSRDGASMVSVGQDASPVLWIVPVDGHDEPRRLTSLRYDGSAGVAWMPDGRILFTSPVRGEQQLWVMDAEGSNRRVITTEGTSAWPQPARDGRFIAFSGVRQGQRGVFRMNPDGTDAQLLAAVPGASYLDITPDGQWITFTATLDGPPSLWRVASNGGTPEPLATQLERSSLSPNGDQAVGVLTEGSRYGVAVLSVHGGSPSWVPSDIPPATGAGIFRWAPDGRGVYFTTAERTNLWYHRLGERVSTKVTNFSEAMLFNGVISPDGRSMLVTRGAVAQDAFLIRNFR